MLGELTKSEIIDVLKGNVLGRIGCRNEDYIYIIPVNYAVADGSILCHSFEGQKIEWMRKNKNVCFEVESIDNYQNWKCVIAHGVFEEITDPIIISSVSAILGETALSKKASLTLIPPTDTIERSHTRPEVSVYYKIVLLSTSGRFEKNIFSVSH